MTLNKTRPVGKLQLAEIFKVRKYRSKTIYKIVKKNPFYLLSTRLFGVEAAVLPARKSSSRPLVYYSGPGSRLRSASVC